MNQLIHRHKEASYKGTCLLAILCALLVAGCFSTRFSPEPPQQAPLPGANHLIIRTVDAPEVARRKMTKLLRREEYAFDTETGPTILTNWRPTPALGNNARLKVSAFIENESEATTITLRGHLRTAAIDNATIAYTGGEGSAARDAFARLEDLAHAYPDGQVYYARD